MIKSFNHKGLKLLWQTNKSNKLPADQLSRIKQMLEVIDSSQKVPQDFEFFISWRIPIKRKLKGLLEPYS